ncbi:MAG: hypothetical protein R2728_06375 [Chitinophagales bacterium]
MALFNSDINDLEGAEAAATSFFDSSGFLVDGISCLGVGAFS